MTRQTNPCGKTSSKPSTSGCGCGGSGRNSGAVSTYDATCGCQEGLTVRPNFFAGQLLTDEDLQALTDYILTKRRLHNRFIVGSGVACGLAVTCHPCGGGKVIVQPGYALDCCGNDIFVPCPVELDINAMVRDLKFKRLGRDCGAPCTDAIQTSRKTDKKEDCLPPADRYCLYLTYCETPSDPVAPYVQGDACYAACQPTRIREGYAFELRCPGVAESPPSMADRIRCCLGEFKEADHQSRDFERTHYQLHSARAGIQAFEMQTPAEFTSEDIGLVYQTRAELEKDMVYYMEGSTGAKTAARKEAVFEEGGGGEKRLTEKVLRRSLDNVHRLGAAIVRYDLLPDQEKRILAKKQEGLPEEIGMGREMLMSLAPRIDGRTPEFLTSAVEQAAADTALKNTLRFVNPQVTMEERLSCDGYLYAYNTLSGAKLNRQFSRAIENFRSWLLRKMHQCPPTTECSLIQEVSAVVVPAGETLDEATLVALDILARALLRYLLDCLCTALIPPCPTCEDPAVKLACLDVSECQVDHICNMERTFLLTEHNLRYWLPFLHGFGELLETLCCEFSRKLDQPLFGLARKRCREEDAVEASQAQAQIMDERGHFSSGRQFSTVLAEQPAFPYLLRIVGLKADSVLPGINLGNSLANMSVRQPQVTNYFLSKADLDAVSSAGNMVMTGVFDDPHTQKAIQAAAEKQLVNIQSHIETLVDERLKVAEEVNESVKRRMRDVEKDLSTRLTVTKLSSVKVIKDLKAALDHQVNENKTIATRLEQLEKELKK